MGADRHIIVAGAGIVGVSTAIWLQRAGAAVTLVDRQGPAAGASWGNAGILAASSIAPVTMPGLLAKAPGMLLNPDKPLFLRWAYLPRLLPFLRRYLANATTGAVAHIAEGLTQLLADTVEQHEALASGTGAERYVRRGDYLYAYGSRADHRADDAVWRLRRQHGFRFEEMGAEALAAYDPMLAGRFGYGVRTLDHGHVTDPGAYITALARHFEDSGGTFHKAEVRDVIVEDGRAVGVMTDAGPLHADGVVLTAGAWSGRLAKTLGVTVPLEAERGYHIEFIDPSHAPRAPTMIASGKFVATPMEGRLRCAGIVEFGGLEAGPSAAPLALLHRQMRRLFPDLRYSRVEEWMGHRPATSDSLPVIGAAPRAANVWLGYGHQHVGLTGGPKTGRWLAQLALGRVPNVDLSTFAADRRGLAATA
ncbi:MAG: FAD-dependent oxidoreductase [Pseudomonadota bacterium]